MIARLAFVLVLAAPAAAQAGSEIWLADLAERDGAVALVNVRRVTDRPGYDNQPRFTADGRALLYTSYRDGQSDIWRYDLGPARHTQLTHTPESEYSPTPRPGVDGRIGVVRVERDSTQRLWTFDPDGAGFQLLAPTLRGIGYYAWAPGERVVAYLVGDTSTLELADLPDGARRVIARNVGPTLQVLADGETVLFARREGERSHLTAWPIGAEASRDLGTLPGGPYFVVDPGGNRLFTTDGERILVRPAGEPAAAFTAVEGLTGLGLTGITRMALSPDGTRLAFVAAEPD